MVRWSEVEVIVEVGEEVRVEVRVEVEHLEEGPAGLGLRALPWLEFHR